MFGTRDIELSPATPVALIELDDLKAALSITGEDKDDQLAGIIAEVSASIEGYCGTVFGQRTVTERHYLTEAGQTMLLRYTPTIALTSVTSGGVAQTNSDYRLNAITATLRRIDHACFECGDHVIVYTAGYADVPPAVARAAMEFAEYLYGAAGQSDDIYQEQVADVGQTTYASTSERTLSANGVALPVRVALMLAPYKRLYFS